MIKWILMLLLCWLLWLATDVRADNVFQNVLAPLILIVFLISSVVSFLYKVGILKGQVVPGGQGDGSGGYIGGFGSGSSGGDCGGSDGGGDGG